MVATDVEGKTVFAWLARGIEGPGYSSVPIDAIAIAIRTEGAATSADHRAALFDYSRRIAADPRVTRVDSLVEQLRRGNEAAFEVIFDRYHRPELACIFGLFRLLCLISLKWLWPPAEPLTRV